MTPMTDLSDAPPPDDDGPPPEGPPPWLTVIEGGDSPAPDRPQIRITVDEARVIDEAIAALGRHPDVYQRGGQLVHVTPAAPRPADAVQCDAGTPTIRALPDARLSEMLATVAEWRKYDGRAKRDPWKPSHPPPFAVHGVKARGVWPSVRPLEAALECPVLKPDGTLLLASGYDAPTGLLHLPRVLVDVPDRPTRADALAAVATLHDLVADEPPARCGFPFQAPEHFATFLAAVLTPLARRAIRGVVPMFLVDANVRNVGKSKLADLVGAITCGRALPRMRYSTDPEEQHKAITAVVSAGHQVVLLDNLVGEFGSDAFDIAITGSTWQARRLGRNDDEVMLPLGVTWIASGNNVTLAADTASRALHVRLRSPDEDPGLRTQFRHPDVVNYAVAERSRYLAAALTILRAFCVAGRPPTAGVRAFGRFSQWADLVRGAVVWAGCADPCVTQFALLSRDEKSMAVGQLIEGLEQVCRAQGGPLTSREIVAEVEASPVTLYTAFRDAYAILCPSRPRDGYSPTRLGKALAAACERVVEGRAITRAGTDRAGAVQWHVVALQRPA